MSNTLIPTWLSTIIFYRGEGAICGDEDDMRKETTIDSSVWQALNKYLQMNKYFYGSHYYK